MLANTLDVLKKERATFAREVEYLKETALDDAIDERLTVAESMYIGESIEELEEAASMVEKLDVEDEAIIESAEIDKILNSESDITFEEMIGIN